MGWGRKLGIRSGHVQVFLGFSELLGALSPAAGLNTELGYTFKQPPIPWVDRWRSRKEALVCGSSVTSPCVDR